MKGYENELVWRSKIYLNTIDRVKDFIKYFGRYSSDIDVFDDRYHVDGKSILGLFSLNLTHVLDVEIHADSEAELATFKEIVKKWETD